MNLKQSKLAIAYALAGLPGVFGPSFPLPKKKAKCLLPTCEVMTSHNKGFCCAEHFKSFKNKK